MSFKTSVALFGFTEHLFYDTINLVTSEQNHRGT